MAPVPSKLNARIVPGTRQDDLITGDIYGVWIEPNVDTTCFSIRQILPGPDGKEEDLIHFCDWPELRDTIDQFMKDRAAEEKA